jgi:hypothetical protein
MSRRLFCRAPASLHKDKVHTLTEVVLLRRNPAAETCQNNLGEAYNKDKNQVVADTDRVTAGIRGWAEAEE